MRAGRGGGADHTTTLGCSVVCAGANVNEKGAIEGFIASCALSGEKGIVKDGKSDVDSLAVAGVSIFESTGMVKEIRFVEVVAGALAKAAGGCWEGPDPLPRSRVGVDSRSAPVCLFMALTGSSFFDRCASDNASRSCFSHLEKVRVARRFELPTRSTGPIDWMAETRRIGKLLTGLTRVPLGVKDCLRFLPLGAITFLAEEEG